MTTLSFAPPRVVLAKAGSPLVLAFSAVGLAVLTAAGAWLALSAPGPHAHGSARLALAGIAISGTVAALVPMAFAVQSILDVHRGRRLCQGGEAVAARHPFAAARRHAVISIGCAVAVWVTLAVYTFVTINSFAVQRTFLDWPLLKDSTGQILQAAALNVKIAVIAEACILVWALVLAVMRLLPGPEARPIRSLAIAYIDVFRALPAIVIIYLVCFGLPLTGVSGLQELNGMWGAVLALTLTYSAYVAELYRSGIEAVHPSQTAAARSLGLSAVQTWCYVVLPQAVRRLIPPLLGYFVSLQKDTALVLVVGLVDAFAAAKIYSAGVFNLSPVTLVGLMFLIITVPQTRLVDYLLRRQDRRMEETT
ncbi:amino acid ABC transporter permease [Nocardia sp. CA-107356]|uniref:amino acid ABC transporter permease n=1 Tax=Nocardia sp. CA-107356 TaxID=3239972 RepID=UPI003D8C2E92